MERQKEEHSINYANFDTHMTDPNPLTLMKVLESLARSTWSDLRDGESLGVRQGEVTITDRNLLRLARVSSDFEKTNGQARIHIFKCPSKLEARTGFDWDWFIGNDSNGWFRFVIQAKKLYHLKKNRYESLKKKVKIKIGDSIYDERQDELILEFASRNKASALYCFYNYLDAKPPFLKRHWYCCQDFEAEQLGCTLADATAISMIIDLEEDRTFQNVHRSDEALPWRCIMCPNQLNFKDEYSNFPTNITKNESQESSSKQNDYLLRRHYHQTLPFSLSYSSQDSPQLVTFESIYSNATYVPRRLAVFETDL